MTGSNLLITAWLNFVDRVADTRCAGPGGQ